jgi:hypothetical protein
MAAAIVVLVVYIRVLSTEVDAPRRAARYQSTTDLWTADVCCTCIDLRLGGRIGGECGYYGHDDCCSRQDDMTGHGECSSEGIAGANATFTPRNPKVRGR